MGITDIGMGATGAGIAVTGAGVAATGVGAAVTGVGATGAGTATGKGTLIQATPEEADKQKPRASGVFSEIGDAHSDRAAAPVNPAETDRTDAAARHDDNRGAHHTRANHNHLAVGAASAIGSAMEAEATAACGVRSAEACDRACNQSCWERYFMFSPFIGPGRGS
jgi:hypothetical protein